MTAKIYVGLTDEEFAILDGVRDRDTSAYLAAGVPVINPWIKG